MRSVVSPKSVVVTIAVAEIWPFEAPFGIVVVNVARPFEPVVSWPDVIAGTPGTASVNVTWPPVSAYPSGSVTVTVSVTASGSFDRLTE